VIESSNLQAVRAFEHAGWQRAAPAYGTTFARATSGFICPLLDAARVETVIAPRAAHPGIRFEEGDAEALPFAEGSFDTVVANFGIHNVPDPVRASSEARRVLRPGGRIAFTSWVAPAEKIAWKLLFEAISAHGDLTAAKTPPSGGGLRIPEDLLRVLDAAFAATAARRVTGQWRFAAAEDLSVWRNRSRYPISTDKRGSPGRTSPRPARRRAGGTTRRGLTAA
jgi:SAM-dependent methyltransferase